MHRPGMVRRITTLHIIFEYKYSFLYIHFCLITFEMSVITTILKLQILFHFVKQNLKHATGGTRTAQEFRDTTALPVPVV